MYKWRERTKLKKPVVSLIHLQMAAEHVYLVRDTYTSNKTLLPGVKGTNSVSFSL